MKDDTIGNPQVTDLELAWLAGLYDGEGSFFICKNGSSKYQMRVTLTNTDSILIAHTVEILDRLGVGPWVSSYTPKSRNSRIAYHIVIGKMANAKKFITSIEPYLVGRSGQASLVLRFIESRLKYEGTNRGIQAPYTDEEDQIYNDLKALNVKGTSTTNTPSTPTPGVKIESELRRNPKTPAEMTGALR